MIDVEIHGPINEKKYKELERIFSQATGRMNMDELPSVFRTEFGGAQFLLVDMGEGDLYYYEARITVGDPVSAKEAHAKLITLAKKLKLPMWNNAEMAAFLKKFARLAPKDAAYETPLSLFEKFGV
jgi:hypothetical protein